jgi:hypothetical protein
MDIELLMQLAAEHKWFALAAIVVGAIIRALKTEAAGYIFSQVPAFWKRVVPLALGCALGALESLASGRPLTEALLKGALLAGGGSMVGHDWLIEGVRGGRELGDPPPSYEVFR